jgi:predicted nucleic acid-binding protein
MYLPDTVVVSDLRRRGRHPQTASWAAAQRSSDLFMSVVTIGEIERGIARQRAGAPEFAEALAAWLDRVLALYGERVLSFDLRSARRWGQLCATLGNTSADLQIAATALEHGLTLVTRNLRHFQPTGVRVIDPLA